jgi:hypothetical protein
VHSDDEVLRWYGNEKPSLEQATQWATSVPSGGAMGSGVRHNARSRAVMERIGMRYAGEIRTRGLVEGTEEEQDDAPFAVCVLLRSDWSPRPDESVSYTAEVERHGSGRISLRAQRDKLKATDPAGLADAWAMIDELWQGTTAWASALPESILHERVDGEWSFVQTQRHLLLVTDCWLRRMIKGIDRPYHPWGLAGSWLTSPRRWGLDPDANPSLDQVLDLRRKRMDEIRDTIASASAETLARICVPPATPGHPRKAHTALHCLHVLLKEEWRHHQYAVRDLKLLDERR